MKMKIPQTFFSVVILFSHQISQTHNHLIVYRTITCKYAFLQEIKTKMICMKIFGNLAPN